MALILERTVSLIVCECVLSPRWRGDSTHINCSEVTLDVIIGVVVYMIIYLIMTLGTFGCVLAMRRRDGAVEEIADLAGLARTNGFMAFVIAMMMFSLAGIPPLAGFFGKFSVFVAALQAGGLTSPLGVLTLLAIALSAVALYYYLAVLKQALVVTPSENTPTTPICVPVVTAITLLAAAGLIVALGLFPSLVLNQF